MKLQKVIKHARSFAEPFCITDGDRFRLKDVIRNTATDEAPWYVIPADNKWFTRIVVASAVITTLALLDLAYPTVSKSKLKDLELARQTLMKTNGLEAPVESLQAKAAGVGV